MATRPGAPDPFEHDDAAYVLGALDPAEAAAFEQHLATCAACRARVQQARATLALLGTSAADRPVSVAGAVARSAAPMSATDTAPTDTALPDTVLPAVVRAVRHERRRRQGLVTGLAAVAAACLIALLVTVWPQSHPAGRTGTPQAMTPVGYSPVRATALLVDHRWGTAIDVHCRYAQGLDTGVAYDLRVVDRDGVTHAAGSWQLAPGGTTDFVGGTQVRRARIGAVQVTLPDGRAVLQLAVH